MADDNLEHFFLSPFLSSAEKPNWLAMFQVLKKACHGFATVTVRTHRPEFDHAPPSGDLKVNAGHFGSKIFMIDMRQLDKVKALNTLLPPDPTLRGDFSAGAFE